eukprot:COSAG05_NODE_15837_length_360_cov_0.275862_1_plen_43_part_10
MAALACLAGWLSGWLAAWPAAVVHATAVSISAASLVALFSVAL